LLVEALDLKDLLGLALRVSDLLENPLLLSVQQRDTVLEELGFRVSRGLFRAELGAREALLEGPLLVEGPTQGRGAAAGLAGRVDAVQFDDVR